MWISNINWYKFNNNKYEDGSYTQLEADPEFYSRGGGGIPNNSTSDNGGGDDDDDDDDDKSGSFYVKMLKGALEHYR